MIRINLLPKEERRPGIAYARISAFFLTLVLLIIVAVYGVGTIQVWKVQQDLADVQNRYETVQPVRLAMEQAGDKQKQIDAKMGLVNSLMKLRTTPYNLMTRVAELMPDKIWIDSTKVIQNDVGTLEMKGEAIEYPAIAEFISRMENSGLFKTVGIKSTEGDIKAGTLKFTLEVKLKEM